MPKQLHCKESESIQQHLQSFISRPWHWLPKVLVSVLVTTDFAQPLVLMPAHLGRGTNTLSVSSQTGQFDLATL